MRYHAIYGKTGKIAEFENGELVWASPEYLHPQTVQTHMVMPDIQPYQSMVDGSMITSRSAHRAHLRQHRLVEIGNETKYLQSKPLTPPQGLKKTLIEVANSKL